MPKANSILLLALTVFAALASIECDKELVFTCPKEKKEELPNFPPAFSTDVRLNFANQHKTVDLRHYKDEVGKRESLEIFAQGRHVKYIVHGEQHLLITFLENDFPTCSVKSSSTIQLEDEDSGPNGILQKISEVSLRPKEFFFLDNVKSSGLFTRKWEGCFEKPSINVAYSFTAEWNNPGNGTKGKVIPVIMEAKSGDDEVVGMIDNFQATMPEDIYFQPPVDVYCSGFREDKKPPEIKEFFSYDTEMVMFSRIKEIAPFVLHRTVYYDYKSRLTRIDFHDLTAEIVKEDSPNELKAKGTSVIHDYNAKIVYFFDFPSLKCEVSDFETTEGVVEEKETKESPMITAMEYLGLNTKKISYNGQFMTRGFLSDVYTASVSHLDGSNGTSVYTWYFSSVNTQVVENEKTEKDVLLRMVVHPESGTQRTDRIEMNLFHFAKQVPDPRVFDITNCYNEKFSKLYVLTFPASEPLRGSENFLKLAVHLALIEFTGLSKQRIFVSEVVFNKEYMFVEFKLLEPPHVLKKKNKDTKETNKEASASEAAAKLKAAVSDGSFKLTVSASDEMVTVVPLKDGFNEFSGDRKVVDPTSFGQGSVVALTIGMLLLGFVLGGVALNLIVSRKFGVSLFSSKRGGDNFNNPLNESGM